MRHMTRCDTSASRILRRISAQFALALSLAIPLQCGAAELMLLIEEPDAGAIGCNISRSALEARARFTLRAAGVQAIPLSPEIPMLYLTMTVTELKSMSWCAGAMSISVEEYYRVRSDAKF